MDSQYFIHFYLHTKCINVIRYVHITITTLIIHSFKYILCPLKKILNCTNHSERQNDLELYIVLMNFVIVRLTNK